MLLNSDRAKEASTNGTRLPTWARESADRVSADEVLAAWRSARAPRTRVRRRSPRAAGGGRRGSCRRVRRRTAGNEAAVRAIGRGRRRTCPWRRCRAARRARPPEGPSPVRADRVRVVVANFGAEKQDPVLQQTVVDVVVVTHPGGCGSRCRAIRSASRDQSMACVTSMSISSPRAALLKALRRWCRSSRAASSPPAASRRPARTGSASPASPPARGAA